MLIYVDRWEGGEEMERCYNLNQVADLLGIKVRTVREWVKNGKIRANKLAGSTRWAVSESEIARLQNG